MSSIDPAEVSASTANYPWPGQRSLRRHGGGPALRAIFDNLATLDRDWRAAALSAAFSPATRFRPEHDGHVLQLLSPQRLPCSSSDPAPALGQPVAWHLALHVGGAGGSARRAVHVDAMRPNRVTPNLPWQKLSAVYGSHSRHAARLLHRRRTPRRAGGMGEVYRARGGPGVRSSGGGRLPRWRADGRADFHSGPTLHHGRAGVGRIGFHDQYACRRAWCQRERDCTCSPVRSPVSWTLRATGASFSSRVPSPAPHRAPP